MFTRRLQLNFFIASLQHHYRARLQSMTFPFVTNQILNFLVCLRKEQLICGFVIKPDPKHLGFRNLVVYFYYINNNALLFRHIRTIAPRIYLTQQQIQQWLHQKTSLIFPILFVETPTHGIITDRQLVYLQIHNKTTSYCGGRLIARIDNW